MSYRRRAILGLCLMALSETVLAEEFRDIAGDYDVWGRNRDGSTYAGIARIVQFGSAVEIAWIVEGAQYQGTGRFDGRVLEIRWSEPEPVVYVLRPDGALHGTWDDGRALDRLTPR